MTLTLSALQKQRRDTAANWTAENPTLLAGEIGIESDTGKIKIGNGSTAWASLGYQGIIPSSGAYPLSQLLMPSGTASVPSISFDGDTNLGVYRSGTDQLGFATAGTERMRLDSSGRLGLGTSSPGTLLDVVGGVGRIRTGAKSGSNTYLQLQSTDASNSMELSIANSTNANWQIQAVENGVSYRPLILNPAGGNVGIGTTSPGVNLEIAGTTPAIRLTETDSTGFSQIYVDSGVLNIDVDPTAAAASSAVRFNVDNFECARIDSSGRLLVGTSSDSGGALLQVNGDRIRIATAKTPASASDTGTTGEICWDANYIYLCTATNTWKRSAISTW